MLTNAHLTELLLLMGRIGLITMLLGITYFTYWKYHPERRLRPRSK